MVKGASLATSERYHATLTFFRQEIAEISLDQIGLPNTRKLAVVDKNRDLFVANVRQYNKGGHGGGGGQQSSGKIGAMVQSLKWNSDSNMLAALQE